MKLFLRVMILKGYKINEYLELRLEGKGTVIYVGGKRFLHCKYLLIDKIKGEDLLEYENQFENIIEEMQRVSIDELAEKYGNIFEMEEEDEFFEFEITPEEVFKAHCSAIQAWAENNYDTTILHSNLAFPLLKKLIEVGDISAKKIFKNEIAKRFENGIDSTRDFLILEGYLNYLTKQELKALFPENINILEGIEKKLNIKFRLRPNDSALLLGNKNNKNQSGFALGNNGIITKIGFYNCFFSEKEWEWIFEEISKINSIEHLYLARNQIEKVGNSIGELNNLKILKLNNNRLKNLPDSLGSLIKLKRLSLNKNQIEYIPSSIGRLRALEFLDLENNKLKTLPPSIGNLKSLRAIKANNNMLESIPESIGDLEQLRVLLLSSNKLKTIPESISNLTNLETLFLCDNDIGELPRTILNLNKLDFVTLDSNDISESNEIVKKLKKKARIII